MKIHVQYAKNLLTILNPSSITSCATEPTKDPNAIKMNTANNFEEY